MSKEIIPQCKCCGKQISKKSWIKSGRKSLFCSRQCIITERIASRVKRNKRTCQCCNKDYSPIKGKNTKFCSKSCMNEFVARDTSTSCSYCGSAFTPIRKSKGLLIKSLSKTKYCSEKCQYQGYMASDGVNCEQCNVLFSPIRFIKGRVKKYRQLKYCSKECSKIAISDSMKRRTYLEGIHHPNWQGGSHRPSFRGHKWRNISEAVRVAAKRVCEKCGKTEKENGRRLDVNHITPFHQSKNKTAANHHTNLEALCQSCHTKTDWKWRKDNQIQISLPLF